MIVWRGHRIEIESFGRWTMLWMVIRLVIWLAESMPMLPMSPKAYRMSSTNFFHLCLSLPIMVNEPKLIVDTVLSLSFLALLALDCPRMRPPRIAKEGPETISSVAIARNEEKSRSPVHSPIPVQPQFD